MNRFASLGESLVRLSTITVPESCEDRKPYVVFNYSHGIMYGKTMNTERMMGVLSEVFQI